MQMDFYEALKKKKAFSLKIRGQSMYPLFRSGDIVRFRQVPFAKIRLNDIVLVLHHHVWFAHRVVYRADGYVVTQGDNNQRADGIIRPKHVVAVACAVTRNKERYDLNDVYSIQSSLYQGEISRLQKSFSKKGVQYVFLKGLPLYKHYFKSVPRRLLADCDLLVRPGDSAEVDRIFAENGYTKESEYLLSYISYSQQAPTELGFVKYVKGLPVVFDVHYEVTPKTTHFRGLKADLRAETEKMIAGSHIIRASGKAVPVLAGDDLVFFLLIHLINHVWGGFFRFDFLIKVMATEGGNIDWKAILTKAKHTGLINFVYPSLYYLSEFYGVDEPLNLYRKRYGKNHAYSSFLMKMFFGQTKVEAYNTFRLGTPNKLNKFLLRFLLYDKPFISKIIDLFQQNFLGYMIYLSYRKLLARIIRIRRNRGSSGTVQQKADPRASRSPAF